MGVYPSDEVTPLGQKGGTNLGDTWQDGRVSFYVSGVVRTGYISFGQNDEIRFFPDYKDPSHERWSCDWSGEVWPPYFSQGISRWASKIDPIAKEEKPEWPVPLQEAERKKSDLALHGVQAALGLNSKELDLGMVARDLTQLPIGHPAKEYLDKKLKEFGVVMSLADGFSGLPRSYYAQAVYKKYETVLVGMKSVGTYYEAGKKIWEEFPHLKDKDKIRILYPAAGNNVGALASAMALIDQGARSVEVVFTEIDETTPDEAVKILKEWSDSNPSFYFLDGPPRVEMGVNGGKRVSIDLKYKGSWITLQYAINDGDRGFYFSGRDAIHADVWISHDPYSGLGQTEGLFLKQIFPWASLQVLLTDAPPTALLMTNELYSKGDYYPSLESVLPVKGWVVEGGFGHANFLESKREQLGLQPQKKLLREIGASDHEAAIILPLHEVVEDFLGSREEASLLVDFSQMAGSFNEVHEVVELYRDPPGEPRLVRSVDSQKKDFSNSHAAIFQWATHKLAQLTGEKRQLFALVAARLVLHNEIYDMKKIKLSPKEIEKRLEKLPKEFMLAVSQTLTEEKIIPSPHFSHVNKLAHSNFRALEKVIRRLDQRIKDLQRK